MLFDRISAAPANVIMCNADDDNDDMEHDDDEVEEQQGEGIVLFDRISAAPANVECAPLCAHNSHQQSISDLINELHCTAFGCN